MKAKNSNVVIPTKKQNTHETNAVRSAEQNDNITQTILQKIKNKLFSIEDRFKKFENNKNVSKKSTVGGGGEEGEK